MNTTQVTNFIESKKDLFFDLNDKIWDYAEIRFKELKSSKLQIDALKEDGFEIETGQSGMESAFIASYGSGKPVIGILGEYDALSDLSQKADVFHKEPVSTDGAGHGCGHNTLGVAALASAMAVKEYLISNNLSGTVRYYGCPAEESGGGKAFLVRDGYFDDVDAAFTWHPFAVNSVIGSGFLANVKVLFDFEGVSSHAAASPELGRSALDGVELMNIGVNFLREHMIDDARIHYAITDAGGNSPNVVQPKAQVFYTVRAPKTSQVKDLFERVKDIAKGAALMTGTKVKTNVVAGYADYLANETLTKIMEKHAKEVLGNVEYTEDELNYAKKYQETFSDELKTIQRLFGMNNDFVEDNPMLNSLMPSFKLPGSSDVGNVSYVAPMAQFMGNCYALGTPAHSWQIVAQGKSSITHKGLLTAAKILALTAVEVFEEPGMLSDVKKDHEVNLDGQEYYSLITEETKPGQI